ncbi:peroxiredoxin Q/BCP [Kineosphaera limosa]|uniref:thioredoxin-dependent peroxiredoxin n=1 Tax=Kineosphaera limosa NBRC 100340 TaxID=1184609 RepID=K6WEN9_9MICO|nr:thioredoxin-dependent thiol peroxidase [Kineosphaera limosa]NYE02660.1 peroxiredoxin Q/BCP [Kineosphaera limosa]GAB97750.1 peroxiredoxin Bcp [Kineosphaera limosa NBRC 100340]
MTRLQPGDPAPPFTLPDQDGATVSLSDFAGRKVIVFVYPAAMTPGCTTQACDFRDALTPLRDAGYAVVGLSPDEPAKLAKFAERDSLTYPLLADPSLDVLRAYAAYGTKKLYGKEVVGVIRSTFVIAVDDAGNGTIEVARYNVKATGHVASLAKALKVTVG